MNTNNIERRLLERFSDTYRRIWVQYSTLSKGRSEYRAVITLFPLQGQYTMLFTPTINTIEYEIFERLIGERLTGTD
jgi:hypothetical protein